MANIDTKEQQSSTKTQIELHMRANPEYLCVAPCAWLVRWFAKCFALPDWKKTNANWLH